MTVMWFSRIAREWRREARNDAADRL